MKFLVAYNPHNVFSFQPVPVTNAQFVQKRLDDKLEVSEADRLAAYRDPMGEHHNGTFNRVKEMMGTNAHVSFA